MYKKILVALENSRADDTLVPHIAEFARRMGSALLLLHVADGFAARNHDSLQLAESDEMKADRAYLDGVAAKLRAAGLAVETELALGNPPTEILKTAGARTCDLIAMTSHGHKIIGDFFLGSTIDKVRHNTALPILVVRAGEGWDGGAVSHHIAMNSRYWFELAVVFGLVALGNILLAGFAQHEPKWRRIVKMLIGAAIAVLVSATAGREWFFILVGIVFAAVLVVHGWYLPRHGINGWTAEPREKYFALRGWTDKAPAQKSGS